MKKSTTYPFVLAALVAMLGALISAGFVVSAQNSNSSTTMTNSNTNAAKPRRPRRPAPKPAKTPDAGTEMTAPAETTATTTAPRRRGGCDPDQQEQTDLSGTYTGKVKHGDQPEMDGTLTITGNNFTISMGSESRSGRIVAVTTCGYTAVTVMPEGATHAHSLRAKKIGDSLTLMSVPGEPEKMMFTTGGGMRRPRRHRTSKPAAPATPPSEMSPPAPVKTPTPE